ncbi:MAG: Gfo/Idh/MocA family oxidoreductase [Ruminococcaceae bacterium]|nr:Gfo/Idh/MocA family oxidoreductase [Oscillospiraceae bacterium]
MKKVKIAQIGTSRYSHGNHIWQSLNKQSDVFEVVGYAFPENEREKFPGEMPKFEGYREMTVEEILNDPSIEAVAVETEEIYLTKYALMVAKAGKHLHMEKPGGFDVGEFRALVDLLQEKGLVFSTGYMYRFNPVIKDVLRRIKNGELGEIYSVEAQMNCKHPPEAKKWLECFPDGMLSYLGCHLIDLIYMIQGEPQEIIPLSCSTGIDGIQTTDFGMVVFRYANGVSFAKTTACESGGFMRRQLVICGSKGTVELKPIEVLAPGGQYTVVSECDNDEWHQPWDVKRTEIYDRYDDMMKNFAQMVRGKENPYSYDYELKLYELLLKCCRREI